LKKIKVLEKNLVFEIFWLDMAYEVILLKHVTNGFVNVFLVVKDIMYKSFLKLWIKQF